MLNWDEFDDSYWFECADVKTSRPLWPRVSEITGEMLWLKPCIRGKTSYYTRGGSYRQDVRWISKEMYIEKSLKYKK